MGEEEHYRDPLTGRPPGRLGNLTTNMRDMQGLGLEDLARQKYEGAMGKEATDMRWVVGQKHGETGMLAMRMTQ